MTIKVGIIMGSRSDWETMQHASAMLDTLGVHHEAIDLTSVQLGADELRQGIQLAPWTLGISLWLDSLFMVGTLLTRWGELEDERARLEQHPEASWSNYLYPRHDWIREALDRKLPFLDFVDVHYISALHGSNIFDVLGSASAAAAGADRESVRLRAPCAG